MPDATVSHELHHYDLKSLEGAYVKLRQLSYYEMLVRRDKGSIASMESEITRGGPQTAKMILESLQTWDRDYLFKNCIAEHNLTDSEGTPLDFNNKNTLNMLNPIIAIEIERLIDDLNGGEGDIPANFQNAASNSSEQVNQKLSTLEITDSQTS